MTAQHDASPRRLAPEARRRHLLDAGLRCIAREGLTGFTMEGVAREAGVTGALPRHYFGTREGMLLALWTDMLGAVRTTLTARDRPITLAERLEEHLHFLEQYPWCYAVWLHAGELEPSLAELVAQARRDLVIASGFGTAWESMTRSQQLAGLGWIGYAESVFHEWINGGCHDRDVTLQVLLRAAEPLGVAQPKTRLTEGAAS